MKQRKNKRKSNTPRFVGFKTIKNYSGLEEKTISSHFIIK